MFYSCCGYTFSQPVCAFGGSSKLKMDMFSKCAPTVMSTPSIAANNSSQKENLKQSSQNCDEAQNKVPSQVAPPPPPPPPGPPPPQASTKVSSNDVVIPDASLVLACSEALSSPSLVAVMLKLAPKLLLIEQDRFPPIDTTQANKKNTEEVGGKMCMSKKLL